MRRFRFEQEQLLRLRQQLKQVAELKLRKAASRLLHVRRELTSLEAELADLSHTAAIHKSPVESQSSWQWLRASEQLQFRLRQARQVAARYEQEREAASAAVRQAESQLESLKVLRSVQWLAHREQLAAEQNQALDELAMRQWAVPDTPTEGDRP